MVFKWLGLIFCFVLVMVIFNWDGFGRLIVMEILLLVGVNLMVLFKSLVNNFINYFLFVFIMGVLLFIWLIMIGIFWFWLWVWIWFKESFIYFFREIGFVFYFICLFFSWDSVRKFCISLCIFFVFFRVVFNIICFNFWGIFGFVVRFFKYIWIVERGVCSLCFVMVIRLDWVWFRVVNCLFNFCRLV